MSDTEDVKGATPEGEPMTSEQRAERQHDARFAVTGPAPEWAMRMFGNAKPAGSQPQG